MFTIASEKIKYLGISLAEEMKAPRFERYETLMKTIEDTNRKVFCAHGLEELILLSIRTHLRKSTDSVQFLSTFQYHFYRNRTSNPKNFTGPQKTLNSLKQIKTDT